MNSSDASAHRPGNATDFSETFVDAAIRKLAWTVHGGAHRVTQDDVARHGSIAEALSHVLHYFGCAIDDVKLSIAARDGNVDAVVRSACEKSGLYVREVALAPGDLRNLAGPVLAFRAGEPIVLVPGIWRRWAAIEPGGRRAAHFRAEALDARAFTFYRGLPSEPLSAWALWRAMFGPENRRDLAYALAWGLGAACLSALTVTLLGSMISGALPAGDHRALGLLAAGWVVVAFTSSVLRLSRTLLLTRIGTRMDVGTEAALVGRALSLPISVFKGIGAGDMAERIRGATQFGKAMTAAATDAVLALATVIAYGVLLARTSRDAALAVTAVVAVRALVGGLLLAGMYRNGEQQAVARGEMSGRLFEMLTGIARIKVASAEARAFYQWASTFAVARGAGYRASIFGGSLVASEGLFDVLGSIVLYLVCCTSLRDGGLGVGAFIVANACLGGLQTAYAEVIGGLTTLLPILPKADRVRPILESGAETEPGAAATALEGNVSLRHVTFHYAEDDVRVLDNLSLDIKRGEFVGVVGSSGCGKSTFIKLLLGFYAPSAGSVLLDGKELSTLDLRSVRSQIGAVLQGSELLPSSILFNIVGTAKKTMEDAWAAARQACIEEDIRSMPMQMHTMISDRAVTISGGQKQRILIARALVRKPKLVIFDEATSALDNKTQAGVMAALKEMSCTKIFIAHRLTTVMHADRILVMDKGAIVQEGTFASLMEEEGLFRTLALSQLAEASSREAS